VSADQLAPRPLIPLDISSSMKSPVGSRRWIEKVAESLASDHKQVLSALSPRQQAVLRRIADKCGVPGWGEL
jgi:hypothetical protein